MKKTILLLSAIILFFTGCKKFDDIEASKLEIKNVSIERAWDYIKISGEYEYPVELESMTLLLSEKEDMSEAKSYECVLEGKTFSVEASDLKYGIVYNHCYEYYNGYVKERNESLCILQVKTNNVTNITINSATCRGEVISDGNSAVIARGVCWSTSPKPTISDSHTTDGSGTGDFTSNITNLNDDTRYYVRAYVTNEKGTSYGTEKSFKTLLDIYNGHEYVDLGLPSGLKWATCNVGASLPEEYGDYFAWGEVETKSEYTSDNSLTYGVEMFSGSLIGGGTIVGYDISESTQYDVARVKWGGTWKMPTKTEMQELRYKCTWIWKTQNGNNGYEVTGPNGNHIFLPAAGNCFESSLSGIGQYGCYWTSESYIYYPPDDPYIVVYPDSRSFAVDIFFSRYDDMLLDYSYRYYGRTIRPVSE